MFSNKEPILNVTNLKKYFKSKSATVKAVDNVSFQLHPGEIIGLIGESGSGKTTVANLLLRLIPNATGIVTFEDKIISGKKISRARRKLLHKNIQMTFQNPIESLDPQKNVFSILSEPLQVNNIIKDLKQDFFSDWKKVTEVSELIFKLNIAQAMYKIEEFITIETKKYYEILDKKLDEIKSKWATTSFRDKAERIYAKFYQDKLQVNRDIISFSEKQLENLINLYYDRQNKFRTNKLSKIERTKFQLLKEKQEWLHILHTKNTRKYEKDLEKQKQKIKDFENDKVINISIINTIIKSFKVDASYSMKKAKNSSNNKYYNFYYLDYIKNQLIAKSLRRKKLELTHLSIDELRELSKDLLEQCKKLVEQQLEQINSSTLINSEKKEIKKLLEIIKLDFSKWTALDKKRQDENFQTKQYVIAPKPFSEQKLMALRKRIKEIDKELASANKEFLQGKKEYKNRVNLDLEKLKTQTGVLLDTTIASKLILKKTEQKFKELKKQFLVDITNTIKKYKIQIGELKKENKGDRKIIKLKNKIDYLFAGKTKFIEDLKKGKESNKSFIYEINIYKNKIKQIKHMYKLNKLSIKYIIKKIIMYNKVVNSLIEVGLKPEHAYRYPHEFSGGQCQRIVIARALISNPKIILADELIASLDISIQDQIVRLLINLCKTKGISMIFIAHDLSMIEYISDNILIMHLGKIVEYGSSENIFTNPIHPYTKNLFNSVPKISNSHIPFKADNFELTYLEEYSPFNVPQYYKIENKHYLLAVGNQFKQWNKTKKVNKKVTTKKSKVTKKTSSIVKKPVVVLKKYSKKKVVKTSKKTK